MPAEYFHWRRAANAMTLLELENDIHPWVPTAWQRDLFPPEYRSAFQMLFDGVDLRPLARRQTGTRQIAGRTIPAGARVLTFVGRTLDRLRGFDRFLRLANRLVQTVPDLLVIVVGAREVDRALDVTYYGKDYAAQLLSETPAAQPDRFWLLGAVPRSSVAEVLTATDLHVYPSRTYPVARSLVEALAAGAPVLAWDAPPVREFIEHGQNGFVVTPTDEDAVLTLARAILLDPAGHRFVGANAARQVRQRYAQDAVLPGLARWFDQLVARKG
jgi:glycosyltransferase involved in cell wall biosynthesis